MSKQRVEQSLILGTTDLLRRDILASGIQHAGSLEVDCFSHWQPSKAITYVLDTRNMTRPWLYITYQAGEQSQEMMITLTTTRPNYGGVRWWFICPLVDDGIPCRKRVGKLYLPVDESLFGCRHSHNLVYYKRINDLERMKGTLERRIARASVRGRA